MSTEHQWNDTDTGRPQYSDRTLYQCQLVHHKLPQNLQSDRTQLSAVRSRRLTTVQCHGQKTKRSQKMSNAVPFLQVSVRYSTMEITVRFSYQRNYFFGLTDYVIEWTLSLLQKQTMETGNNVCRSWCKVSDILSDFKQ